MILVLNFKTYFQKTKDYLKFINSLKKLKTKNHFWLAFNPYFYLILKRKIKTKKFKIGIQNLSFLSEKPQTGETVYEFELINQADFVLLGHSERYRLGENLEIVKRKIDSLQTKKLKLIIFFSENSYEPKEDFNQVKSLTQENLNFLLKDLRRENFNKVLLCYEPWWAISSEGGKIPSKKFLEDFLNWYKKNYNFPILYGGSYNSKLKEEYQGLNFDGFVLGRASTQIEEIKKIIS
ncbi:Triosephosphate isomerase [bacterium HR35]|nr:Triosephosphate isomerase [bacterium HR35]